MKEPKLHIRAKKYTGESTVVSLRIPSDMLSEISSIATATHRTRSEVMSMFFEFALEHLDVMENSGE